MDESVHEPIAGDDASEAIWFDVDFRKLSSEIVYESDGEIVKSTYNIELTNKEMTQKCEACVCIRENLYGLLKERKYEIVHSKNIAFDHARFIVNALLYIKHALDISKKK